MDDNLNKSEKEQATDKDKVIFHSPVRCGIAWYKSLTINQKINAKECFELLCGVKWQSLTEIFSMRERIGILYEKLLIEGFDV